MVSFMEAAGAWALRTSYILETVGGGRVIFTQLFPVFTNSATQQISGTETKVSDN